jgi:Ca2+-binding RTX toxin-like protein
VANDTFKGQPGTDLIDGGLGTDTVIYSGPSEQYTVNKSGNRYIVREPTGSVADGAKLMGALLGPAFLKDKALAGIVIGLMDQNYSAEFVATLGLATPLYLGMAGSSSHVDFVKHVFTNVVGRQPLANELNQYVGMLENGSATQASLAVMAANTDLNAARIDLVGLIQHGWEFV